MSVKNDFPFLNKGVTYLDNCATTLKPKCVIDEVYNYYKNFSSNSGRGSYDTSLMVDNIIYNTRKKVAKFINAKSPYEIIFTSGTTFGLNMVINGYFLNYLKPGDEVLTTKAEHASLLLPLFNVCKKTRASVRYIDLDNNLKVTLDNVKKAINKNTRVISLAHVTNVIGDERPIKEIIELAHKNNILVLIDGAQSVPHNKIDVQKLDIDFLCFSGHKMLGPTGIGVMYAKKELLDIMNPYMVGGGSTTYFDSLMNISYNDIPYKFEAGTLNIAGIFGLFKAIDYLNIVGMDYVKKWEIELKKYAIDKLSTINNINIFNKDENNGIITFNVSGTECDLIAKHLNNKGIYIRVGSHCAKALSEVIGVNSTCRISFYLYNTKKDVDDLYNALCCFNESRRDDYEKTFKEKEE